MLFRFKSKVTGDLILLEPAGRRLLRIVGKEPSAVGIIEPAQMAQAIAALERAIADEEIRQREAAERAAEQGEAAPPLPEVSLRQRARPFIDMLRRCVAAGEPVVWGV